MYSILRKELRFRLSGMFWWFIGGLSLALMEVAIFPSMASQLSGMDFPAFFELFGPVAQMYTIEGFLSVEMFGFMVPLVVCIYGVVLGANLLGGEEDEGTLEILAALPVRRWKIVVGKAIALAVLVLIPLLGMLLGTILGLEYIQDQLTSTIEMRLLLLNTLFSWPLALAFAYLGLWLGAYLPTRSIASSFGTSLAVIAYFMDTLGGMVPALQDYRLYSPMYYYRSLDVLHGELDWGAPALLLGLAAILLLFALASFARRNITVHAWPWQRNRQLDAE